MASPTVQPWVQGRMDAARGYRRYHAGRVADQDRAVAREVEHRPAARNQSGPRAAGAELAWQAGGNPDAQQEAVDVGQARMGRVVAQRQAGLDAGRALGDPADVAGCVALADEAVQGAGIGKQRAGEFVLDAIEELAHLAQAAVPRHARTRPVGADQVAGGADPIHLPSIIRPHATRERLAQAQVDAVLAHPPGQPAHGGGRVGGVEVVAGRGQRDLLQARRVQAHLFHAPHQGGRQLAEQRRLGGLLDDDAGGAQLRARIALALEHDHVQAALGRGDGAGGAGKTGADHHQVGGGAGGARGKGFHGRSGRVGPGSYARHAARVWGQGEAKPRGGRATPRGLAVSPGTSRRGPRRGGRNS